MGHMLVVTARERTRYCDNRYGPGSSAMAMRGSTPKVTG